MAGPLDGVRVLDLTGVVSGPFATMFLADQGADVIKVEPLGGDINRRSRRSVDAKGEFSALFISSNRGKRSLAIDLKAPEGREIVERLAGGADVLVQNFRPGTMERLGLGPEKLLEQFPRLIYVSMDGVGDTGPYAAKRVYDPLIQALSGFCDVQAQSGTRRPQMIRTIVADKTTAVVAAQAITAALFARERGGRGQHLKLSMLDAVLGYLWPEAMMQYTVVGHEAQAPDPNDRPDLIFPTTDGYITVGTVSDAEWRGFCAATEDPELAGDARFATTQGRAVNATERIHAMADRLAKAGTQHWLERLDRADVPCAPVLRRHEIVANEQVAARGLIVEFEQPGVGRVRQPRPAARFSETPAGIAGPAPGLGEHSAALLEELGFNPTEIARLAERGVVRLPS